jgi:hypothetical protein
VLAFLRTPRGQRLGAWGRGAGLALLIAAFLGAFLPVPAAVVMAALVPGLALFLVGAAAWLARDEEPWLRRE